MKELIDNLLKLQELEFGAPKNTPANARAAELRATIPPQILGHYDRLMARGKKGVAAVRNQVCAGCHVQVPLAVTMTLMHGDDIRICESCGRYLYLALPEKPTPAKLPKKAARTRKAKVELQTV
jgi:predicted  nucleic acid-binding Zn-ribbon protein